MNATNPKKLSVKGRVSFPRVKHSDAVAFAAKSKYDSQKSPDQINSSVALLLEPAQVQKIVDHVLNEFLPYAAQQNKTGDKPDNQLEPKYIEKIEKFLQAGDWTDAPPNFPIKAINPKYQDQTPECTARLELKGPKGADIRVKAAIENDTQLLIPDPDLLSFPAIVPIERSTFELYPGAYAAATINLYSYFSTNAIYGIGAGVNALVYLGSLEGERLGNGGNDVDEDDIFNL